MKLLEALQSFPLCAKMRIAYGEDLMQIRSVQQIMSYLNDMEQNLEVSLEKREDAATMIIAKQYGEEKDIVLFVENAYTVNLDEPDNLLEID